MEGRARLLNRVKKLLRLSKSPNPHEAARAAEEAERVMRKYNVTIDDVEEDVMVAVDENCDVHRVELGRLIAISRRCRSLVNRKLELAFKGKKGMAEEGRDIYRKLVGEVRVAIDGPVARRADPGYRVWCLFFWIGFVDAIRLRLVDVEKQAMTVERRTEETATSTVEQNHEAPVTSLREEMKEVVESFSRNLLPEDAPVAINSIRRDGYVAGKSLGQRVDLPVSPEKSVKSSLALA